MACHIMMLNFSRKGKVKIIFFITKKHIIGLVLLMEKIRMYRECEGRIKKICPEDRRSASRGLPSYDRR